MKKEDYNIWEGRKNLIDDGNQPRQITNPSGIDIDFRRIISAWPYVLLFAFLGFLSGSVYLRYVENIYHVSTSITIEEKQEVSIGQALFGTPRDPFNDKMAFFKSPALSLKLVDSLGLQYRAEAKGRLKDRNFYRLIKWFIINKEDEDIPEINFTLEAGKDDFKFSGYGESGSSKWGQPFLLKGNKIVIYKLDDFTSQTPIFCYSTDRLATAFEISRGLAVSSNKESNILNISYADISSDRAIDILNGLVKLYNDVLALDKTQSFSQAIDFIGNRIEPLARELDSIETSLAQFKSSRGFVGISSNGELYLQKMKEFETEKNNIDIMRGTITNVENFIKNPSLKEEDLSFVGLVDQGLQNTLKTFQEMRLMREKMRLVMTENSPQLKLMDEQLNEIRGNMDKQVDNYRNNLRIAENKYESNISTAEGLIRNTPHDEKILIGKFRMQSIKETLYLTLLQKREEASIQKASVTVNTKVLSPPAKISAVIKPSKANILMIAVLAGLFLPLVFFLLRELLNNKIVSKKQLQSLTPIPVIAEMEQVEDSSNSPFVVEENKRSMFGEQIRTLRTSINFYTGSSEGCKYIVLTSSVSGEGKSFLSMNLAKSYSLQGKKVALLEFDLRRPKVSSALKVGKDKPGLSSVLIGKSNIEDIVVRVEGNVGTSLDFYPAGAIPPNPQELLTGKYIAQIKTYLDANYEVVVVDTPPYGIVADAQILGEWADVTLIVTRFKQTVKDQIIEINEWNSRKAFRSMALLFNGVRNKGYFGNKYGNYYYKRKYGYTYYSGGNTKG
ncbi:MAG: polysaccharide biosynthesis tyrosine autokinase [Ferruginibacter sp.]|nr:polysaccharide biosynthesis tyrosine autokinase [Ferruginibacter sp.]